MGLVFGLTGGIACGKSTASNYLRTKGVEVVDADVLSREVVRPGSIGLLSVVNTFGDDILQPNGTLDRKRLGEIVFSDARARARLDEAIGPYLQAAIETAVDTARQTHTLVCIDAALLLERNLPYRPVILVTLPREMQIERLMSRNALTRVQAEQRLASQWSHDQRIAALTDDDFVIENTGTVDDLRARLDKAIEHITRRAA